jgi:galactokinase
MGQLESAGKELSDVVFRRCRHVISENARATDAATKLAHEEYEDVGDLMVQSHNSLRDDYEVSVSELDFLVEEAMKVKGVYGARMTGAGFGGCIVALTQPRAVESLTDHLLRTYEARFHKRPVVFATTATAGASVLE